MSPTIVIPLQLAVIPGKFVTVMWLIAPDYFISCEAVSLIFFL